MMDYEKFKETVMENFKDYLSEQFQGTELSVEQVHKINHTKDGIILSADKPGHNVSPTIYINDMYEHFKSCNDLHETLQNAAKRMEAAIMNIPELDFGQAKDNIVFFLVNTEQNREMLADMPHREYHDLSIVYRWIIKEDEEGIQSTVIKNQTAGLLGLNEEQLFSLATKNTQRIYPPTVRSMNDIFYGLLMEDGIPDEIAGIMKDEIAAEEIMYVISNASGINGAASMLYENKLHELAEKLNTDLYILPSSIHEVLAISTDIGSPEELAQMVKEINMSEVSINERLSNQVYHYDKDMRKLTLATDTPDKSLDNSRIQETDRTMHMSGQVR